MKEVRSIAIDLDGTILEMDWDLWVKHRMNYFGEPKEGAIEALAALKKMGFKIIIHTCRISTRINPGYTLGELWLIVEKALNHHKIPYDEIWIETGKPLADYYIDDRGVHFEDWDQTLDGITLFEGYVKNKGEKNER